MFNIKSLFLNTVIASSLLLGFTVNATVSNPVKSCKEFSAKIKDIQGFEFTHPYCECIAKVPELSEFYRLNSIKSKYYQPVSKNDTIEIRARVINFFKNLFGPRSPLVNDLDRVQINSQQNSEFVSALNYNSSKCLGYGSSSGNAINILPYIIANHPIVPKLVSPKSIEIIKREFFDPEELPKHVVINICDYKNKADYFVQLAHEFGHFIGFKYITQTKITTSIEALTQNAEAFSTFFETLALKELESKGENVDSIYIDRRLLVYAELPQAEVLFKTLWIAAVLSDELVRLKYSGNTITRVLSAERQEFYKTTQKLMRSKLPADYPVHFKRSGSFLEMAPFEEYTKHICHAEKLATQYRDGKITLDEILKTLATVPTKLDPGEFHIFDTPLKTN